MTNYEYEILNYIKLNKDVSKFDILNNLHPDQCINTFVLADERIKALINLGMLSSEGNYLFLTPAGLHELDTYLDEQRRYEQIDSRSAEANKLAAEANEIANTANKKSDEANAHAKKANWIAAISALIAFPSAVISVVSLYISLTH